MLPKSVIRFPVNLSKRMRRDRLREGDAPAEEGRRGEFTAQAQHRTVIRTRNGVKYSSLASRANGSHSGSRERERERERSERLVAFDGAGTSL